MPYPITPEGVITLKPGERRCICAASIPYAISVLRGFTVLSDQPIPITTKISSLQIGGGLNLIIPDDACPLEIYRNKENGIREEPVLKAPNTASIAVCNEGPTPVQFSFFLLLEILADDADARQFTPGPYGLQRSF